MHGFYQHGRISLMRRIVRLNLDATKSNYLRRRQGHANAQNAAGCLDIEAHWSASVQTKSVKSVRQMLKLMAGPLESCMYCSYNHGTDIEHFWPKGLHYSRMYAWDNFLLCCTECGRIKGVKFPVSASGEPLLLDPTRFDPWDHLDFDPDTGAITARYLSSPEGYSTMGEQTVNILQLDRREALQRGYQMAHHRIKGAIQEYLASPRDEPAQAVFRNSLRNVSAHGLFGWILSRSTESLAPFNELRQDAQGWGILGNVDVS